MEAYIPKLFGNRSLLKTKGRIKEDLKELFEPINDLD